MLQLERHTTADEINDILNDPGVRPWIANGTEPVDATRQVKNPNNVLLMGEHGGCMFLQVLPGIYEAHTQVKPRGRGAWTNALTSAAVAWMFTRTDAFEITTRVPAGHIAARAAATQAGLRYEFTRAKECLFRDKLVDVHVFSFRIQDWLPTAKDFIPTGKWFHDRLHEEAERLGVTATPHEDDENHNIYVGVAVELVRHGHPVKALSIYNRWAMLSRHPTVRLVETKPVTIRMDIGYLTFVDNDIRVALP